MELEHTFTVPVPPAQAFEVLQDIERIGPCMPGASIDSVDGTSFSGKVKVKIGPIQVTYAGEAEYAEVDREALAAKITARGKETRGSGTANATVTAKLREVDGGTEAHVVTDLAITGRPAQFGRGVMEEVGQKLITQFADCLAQTLGEEEQATPPGGDAAADTSATEGTAPGQAAATTTAPSTARPARSEAQAIDLLDVAGAPVVKRLAPFVGGLVVLWLLWRLIRR
jgi:carbon monoxide dehydrogenase subunit G